MHTNVVRNEWEYNVWKKRGTKILQKPPVTFAMVIMFAVEFLAKITREITKRQMQRKRVDCVAWAQLPVE